MLSNHTQGTALPSQSALQETRFRPPEMLVPPGQAGSALPEPQLPHLVAVVPIHLPGSEMILMPAQSAPLKQET